MNERYLFRGQRVDNGEWVVGSLLVPMGYCTTFRIVYEDLEGFACEKEVVPETVGQYTTLKDKNGKPVFEGDILDITVHANGFSQEHLIGVIANVRYSIQKAKFYLLDSKTKSEWEFYDVMDCEVIGNIHQNRELLEKGGK